MKGAKFIVLSLRDIIKNLVFILIGIALLVSLFLVFYKSGGSNTVEYNPGTYSSQILIKGEPLEVFVTVDSDSISEINTSALDDKQMAYYPLIEPTASTLIPKVLEAQSTNIELTNDGYYTQYVLLTAINDALDQAYKGDKPEFDNESTQINTELDTVIDTSTETSTETSEVLDQSQDTTSTETK